MEETITSMHRLSTAEFDQLAALVYRECGINLPASKKVMLESRLNKRLRALKTPSFKAYIHFLTSPEGIASEVVHMIDVVTTNKTDFFREPHHFTYLKEKLLPQFARGRKLIKCWSAACSSGEEPYTMAMVLEDFTRVYPDLDYEIFASDISTAMLQRAVLAVYPFERAAYIPPEIKKRYLLKSKNTEKPTVRIVPALRKKVRFGRINFKDATFPVDDMFDMIFCRNVLIYFDRKTQSDVICKLLNNLKPGGHLFIGHSESLCQSDLPVVQVKPTIYKKL